MASRNTILAIAVIGLLTIVGLAYGPQIIENFTGEDPEENDQDDNPPGIPDGAQSNKFSFTPYSKDTETALSSATVRLWYDENDNGKMEYSEIGRVTESSGTYTSVYEYPIGTEYLIWAQMQVSTHQTAYAQLYMTGDANTDSTAKPAKLHQGTLDVITTDDSVTYAGLIRNIAWDDGTDYNATLNGADGTAKVVATTSAADKGLSNQLWNEVAYKYIYSGVSTEADKTHDYWVKWDEISSDGIEKWYAPDFFGIIMSEQDSIDFGIKSSDFDGHYLADPTNNYYWMYQDSKVPWEDFFYKSSDSSAAECVISFTAEITATGTTLATTGVTFWHNLEYSDWLDGSWGSTAANYIGTPGSDWDWTVV